MLGESRKGHLFPVPPLATVVTHGWDAASISGRDTLYIYIVSAKRDWFNLGALRQSPSRAQGYPQSGGQAAKLLTKSLVAFVCQTEAQKFAPLFVISKFRSVYLWLVSLKIGGVSRDGHGIKLAYYLPAHKRGQGRSPWSWKPCKLWKLNGWDKFASIMSIRAMPGCFIQKNRHFHSRGTCPSAPWLR